MPRTPWLALWTALGWLAAAPLAGCVGTLAFLDDDDDDDVTGDDDDDDATDDDDDDDATGDDDDATGDDDDDDDDDATGDDDDTEPPPIPGIEFDVPAGPLAGHHAFYDFMSCWIEDGYVILGAGADPHWGEAFFLYLDDTPGDHEHVNHLYLGWWWGEEEGAEGWGPQCFLDTVDGWPSLTGTFQCAGMIGEGQGQPFEFAITDGVVVCP